MSLSKRLAKTCNHHMKTKRPQSGTCRKCGCTEDRACLRRIQKVAHTGSFTFTSEVCFWMDKSKTLCSFCWEGK